MPAEANRATSDCCSLLRWPSGTGGTRVPAACDETWKMNAATETNDVILILIRCPTGAGQSLRATSMWRPARPDGDQRADAPPSVPGRGEVGFAGAARFLEKNGRTRVSICSRTLLV